MLDFEKSVLGTINKYNMISSGDKVIIGLSGGADSVCLLHTLFKLGKYAGFEIAAVHINHCIRGVEADRDEAYCKRLCKKLDIPFISKKIDVPKIAADEKISEELAGRKIRYKVFNELCKQICANKIAVAHNKNDSVETVLMKLVRGCSLNGMRGISPVNGTVVRPLIESERCDIEKYLETVNISYMHDSTNDSGVYTRNVIRNEVLPLLKKINPSVISTIFSNTKNIVCDDDFIESYAKSLYNECIYKNNCDIIVNFCDKDLHNSIKKRIILYAVFLLKGDKNDIEQKHIDMLLSNNKTGKVFDIGSGIIVKTEYGKLIFTKKFMQEDESNYEIHLSEFPCAVNIAGYSINFAVTGNNDISDTSFAYVDYDKLVSGKITLRNRRNGDRFSPSGMDGEKKLKKFFIDEKIPPAIRGKIPILCTNDEIAAILGMRVGKNFIVTDKTKNILKISIFGGTND